MAARHDLAPSCPPKTGFVLFAVRCELLDVHGRRQFVVLKMAWIDQADSVVSYEPDFPMRAKRRGIQRQNEDGEEGGTLRTVDLFPVRLSASPVREA